MVGSLYYYTYSWRGAHLHKPKVHPDADHHLHHTDDHHHDSDSHSSASNSNSTASLPSHPVHIELRAIAPGSTPEKS